MSRRSGNRSRGLVLFTWLFVGTRLLAGVPAFAMHDHASGPHGAHAEVVGHTHAAEHHPSPEKRHLHIDDCGAHSPLIATSTPSVSFEHATPETVAIRATRQPIPVFELFRPPKA